MTLPARLALAALAVVLPAAAAPLEPRFDHRDQQGVLVGFETWRETVAESGKPTLSEIYPRLRAGWGFDLSGEGDELIIGGALRLGDWKDPEGQRYLFGLDARYRGYFGTEELKTFFEVGFWSELRNRLAAGPQVGLGLSYDPNRSFGTFLSLHFGTAFGEARIASVGASVGVQVRYN
jgi:hypothetical protein